MRATLITLIGPQISSDLTDAISTGLQALAGAGGEVTNSRPPHAENLAQLTVRQWSVEVAGWVVREAFSSLIPAAQRAGADLLITPGELLAPGPRLVVTDVDSTLIQDEVIELLAQHAGTRAEVARVTEAAMRGELDFSQSLIERVATLRGVPENVYKAVFAALRLSPGVENLCRVLKGQGDFIGVVSGGFIEIVAPLAEKLEIDFARANALEIANGTLTGRVTGEIVDKRVKARTLRQWAQETGVGLERTIAVGDGANDLDMLAAAGLGVAYNAKPVVQQQADTAIAGPRLDALLAVIGN
ncbi:MAG TPA: phosphoserine phosphatase SerB [Actinomycetales bacterium]|nr:phosphoserine phosphatase SerB [Actinomycetales bacterium]